MPNDAKGERTVMRALSINTDKISVRALFIGLLWIISVHVSTMYTFHTLVRHCLIKDIQVYFENS